MEKNQCWWYWDSIISLILSPCILWLENTIHDSHDYILKSYFISVLMNDKNIQKAKYDWWSFRDMKWRRTEALIIKAGPLLNMWKGGEVGRNSSSSFTQYIMNERFLVHRITLLVIDIWFDKKIIEKSHNDPTSFIMTESISISW